MTDVAGAHAGVMDDRPAHGGSRAVPRAPLLAAALGVAVLVVSLRGGSYGEVARGETFVSVWWVIALAVGFGLVPYHRWSPAVRVCAGAFVALAAWTTLGLLWTGSPERTVDEAIRVLGYAGIVVLLGWLFGERDRPLVVGVLTAVGGAVCLLALAARLEPSALSSALARSGYAASRLDYPFNYWNSLGCWAAMTLALALAASVHAAARWARGAAIAIAAIAPVVAYLTYSRSALVSIGVSSILLIALSSRRWLAAVNALIAMAAAAAIVLAIRAEPEIARGTGTAGRATVLVAIAGAVGLAVLAVTIGSRDRLAWQRIPPRLWWRRVLPVLAACLAVLAVVFGPSLAARAWDSFKGPETPLAADPAQRLTSLGGTRSAQWDVALSIFADDPMHGIGAGTYEFAWNQDPRRTGHVVDAHSLYLEALAEIGWPGALLVIVALGALLVGAIRAALGSAGPARGATAGCAAAFAVYCLTAGVDWMWESTAITVMALALGVVATANPVVRATRPRWPLRTAGAVIAMLVVLVQLPAMVAGLQIRTSQDSARRGRLVDSVVQASSAAQTEPWGSDGQLQLALALERIGRLRDAATAARDAVAQEPENWELWLVIGRIEAERGHVGAAVRAVARARALNPRSPLFQPGVARALSRQATR
jgi:O-Antigen ligase/Tetratricopeptide repeat